MTISLSACSGGDETQNDTPMKLTAVKCKKLSVQEISKRYVELKVKALWAKSKSSPITGYTFQLVDLKRDREPYHFTVLTTKKRAQFSFDKVKPGKYSARVIPQTKGGALTAEKNCMVTIRVR